MKTYTDRPKSVFTQGKYKYRVFMQGRSGAWARGGLISANNVESARKKLELIKKSNERGGVKGVVGYMVERE